MAGYSKRNLAEKLGLKAGMKCLFVNAPEDYLHQLGEVTKELEIDSVINGNYDFIQFFADLLSDLTKNFSGLKSALAKNGSLWISWPKLSSGIKSDLNENLVMKTGLEKGLVDVKVSAIDEVWSGLKFVYRLKDR